MLDLAPRKWLRTLVVPHQYGTSEHVKVVYTVALEDESLLRVVKRRMIEPSTDEWLPILLRAPMVALDDLGHDPGMDGAALVGHTCGKARHPHRPGPHRVAVEPHQRRFPHLEQILRDPPVFDTELEQD